MEKEVLIKKIADVNAKLSGGIALTPELSCLAQPIKIGSFDLANRIAIQPMEGCDGTADGAPNTLTIRRYDRFAHSGAGLVWFEATAIVSEGRANPRQLWLTEENKDEFKKVIDDLRETSMKLYGFAPMIIMQATHSGRYSKPAPYTAHPIPEVEAKRNFEGAIEVTDEYLDTLPEKYALSSKLARKVGFDGVDIKACHGYLLSELLSAFERTGKYGGSLENRTRLYKDTITAANTYAGDDFIVTSRINVYDGYGRWGANADGSPNMAEPIALFKDIHENYGIELIDITMGNPYHNPHVNRPYDKGPYAPPETPEDGLSRLCNLTSEIKRAIPSLLIISSGNSYLRELSPHLAAGLIEARGADMAGFGRLSFAYPEFARDIITEGALNPKKVCLACGKCSELMRANSKAGCVLRDIVYTSLYTEEVMKK